MFLSSKTSFKIKIYSLLQYKNYSIISLLGAGVGEMGVPFHISQLQQSTAWKSLTHHLIFTSTNEINREVKWLAQNS